MNRVTLFGASYSVYVRIVRLVLEEVGIPYDLVEVDIFSKEGVPADYHARQPFGRIPALEHDGFQLFETDAIAGYIVDRFNSGALLPEEVEERARMRQIMRIMDNYGYQALVWGLYVEEMERDRAGRLRQDELERARKCLGVLEDLAAPVYLVGTHLTLADLWTLPMLAYFNLAPSGRALLRDAPKLAAWLERMQVRPTVVATRFPAEQKAL
jgi:glutathione S-transferase